MSESVLRFENLCSSTEWKEYSELFNTFGKVKKLFISPSKEFGHVHYIDKSCALKALNELHLKPPYNLNIKEYIGDFSSESSNSTMDNTGNGGFDYVDTHGRPVDVFEEYDTGELYVSVKELKRLGFEIFPVNTHQTEEQQKLIKKQYADYQRYMEDQSALFLKRNNYSLSDKQITETFLNLQSKSSALQQNGKVVENIHGKLTITALNDSLNQEQHVSRLNSSTSNKGLPQLYNSLPDQPSNKLSTRFNNQHVNSADNNGNWNNLHLPKDNLNRRNAYIPTLMSRNTAPHSGNKASEFDKQYNYQAQGGRYQNNAKKYEGANKYSPFRIKRENCSPNAETVRPLLRQPYMSKPEINSIKPVADNSKSLRISVIEEVSKEGFFQFVHSISEQTFVGVAMPSEYTEECRLLKEIRNDVKTDPSFIPNVGDLVATLKENDYVRATILSVSNNIYQCALIDCGIVIWVDHVCALPNKYVNIPELACFCKANPEAIQEFSQKPANVLHYMVIKRPKSLTVTCADTNNSYDIQTRRWDPPISKKIPSENNLKISNNRNLSEAAKIKPENNTSNSESAKPSLRQPLMSKPDVENLKLQRKLVVEKVSEGGLFQFASAVSDFTFVGAAMPSSYTEEACLLDEIGNDVKIDPTFKPNIGDLVAVPKDNDYVRGVILKISNNKYQCALIDYGSVLCVDHVCILPNKYVNIPEFACYCKTSSEAIKEFLQKSADDHALVIKKPNILTVTFRDTNHSYEIQACRWDPVKTASIMFERNDAKISNGANQPSSASAKTKLDNNTVNSESAKQPLSLPQLSKSNTDSLKPQRKSIVEEVSEEGLFQFVSVVSEETFVGAAMLSEYSKESFLLEEIRNDVKIDPSFIPNIGDLVAAPKENDYVRATILSISNDIYQCALIDYGIVIWVDHVCALPNKYVNIPEFACFCKANPGTIREFSQKPADEFHSLVIKKPNILTVTFVGTDHLHEIEARRWDPVKTTKITSETNNAKISDAANKDSPALAEIKQEYNTSNSDSAKSLLLQPQLSKPNAENLSQRKLVIEKVSDGGFFQFASAVSDFTFVGAAMPSSYTEEACLLDEIGNDVKIDPTFKPNIGDLVAVPKDNDYVRGVILKISNNKYQCALIDYGSVLYVDHVCILPNKYVNIPEFACYCKTSSEAIKEFLQKPADDLHLLTIKKPNLLTVSLVDTNRSYEIQARRWDPVKTTKITSETNNAKISDDANNDSPALAEIKQEYNTSNSDSAKSLLLQPLLSKPNAGNLSQRKLVIEKVSDGGFFQFASAVSDFTFVGAAMPSSYTEEACLLDEIGNDVKIDPTFKPNIGDLVAVPKDNDYVRGVILKISNNKYQCALIDYGSVLYVDHVCILPNKYVNIPEFACYCKTSSEAIKEFLQKPADDLHPLTIKKPNLLTVSLVDTNRSYEIQARRWDPVKTTKITSETNNAKISDTANNDSPALAEIKQEYNTSNPDSAKSPLLQPQLSKPNAGNLSQRKLVIEKVSALGYFQFVSAVSERTFLGVALPALYTEETCLLEEIGNDVKIDPTFKPNIGDIVAVPKENTYVRGVILKMSNNKYQCALIDYGSVLYVDHVCILPNKYVNIPEFACYCKTNSEVVKEFLQKPADYLHSLTIKKPNLLTVSLVDTNRSYEIQARRWDPLKTTKITSEINDAEISNGVDKDLSASSKIKHDNNTTKSEPAKPLLLQPQLSKPNTENSKSQVFVVQPLDYQLKTNELVMIIAQDRGNLFLRTKECSARLKQVVQEINNLKSHEMLKGLPLKEQMVLNIYNDCFYRAKVVSVKDSNAYVHYIDYGSSDTVPISKLINVNEVLASITPCLIKIKLEGFLDEAFTGNALTVLNECIAKKEKLTAVLKSDNIYDLRFKDNSSLSEKIKALTAPLSQILNNDEPLPTKQTTTVSTRVPSTSIIKLNNIPKCKLKIGTNTVCCIFTGDLEQGLAAFCLVESAAIIDNLTKMINEYVEKDNKPYHPQLNEVCLAKFEGEWYRAAYLIESEDEFGMFFCDYGNSQITAKADIRKMPAELANIGCTAALCMLQGVTNKEGEVNEKLLSAFKDLLVETESYEIVVVEESNQYYIITIPSIYSVLKQKNLL